MADTRTARRDAEKTARAALADTLIGTAGDLGVALTNSVDAKAAVAAAREQAAVLLQDARRAGEQLIGCAESAVAAAGDDYVAAWHKARAVGWRTAQLTAMGYPAPPRASGGRRPADVRSAIPDN